MVYVIFISGLTILQHLIYCGSRHLTVLHFQNHDNVSSFIHITHDITADDSESSDSDELCEYQHQLSAVQEDGEEGEVSSRVEDNQVVSRTLVEERSNSDDSSPGQNSAPNISIQ